MDWASDGTRTTKCCRECGRAGVTRHNCPDHPCNFCKEDGHIAPNCPKLRNRPPEQQLERKRSRSSQSPFGTNRLKPQMKRKDHELPSIRINSESDPESNNEADISNIDIALATEALQISNKVFLLAFGPLLNHVVQLLFSDACPKNVTEFKLEITKYSSTRVLSDITSAIDPTIRALEGQVIDCQALQRVREIQKRDNLLFDCDGGYLDFITDVRSDKYFKMYVGQSHVLAERIAQHRNSAARGDITTLHYFIMATGAPSRRMNFIRLFRLDPKTFNDEEYAAVCRDLLELLMTLAFQTMPAQEVEQWLSEQPLKVPLQTLHLNVLNPLYQRSRDSHKLHVRLPTRELLLGSPDPQLARWPIVRKFQITERTSQQISNVGPYPMLHQMADILNDAIKAHKSVLGEIETLQFPLKAKIEASSCSSMSNRLDQLRSRLLVSGAPARVGNLYIPVGSLSSPLAMILNRALIPPKYDRPVNPNSFLPLTFEEMELTDGQVLIWPFNMRNQRGLRGDDQELSRTPDGEFDAFQQFSSELLNDCCASFILISEGVAQESLFKNSPLLSEEFGLLLRSFKVKGRLLIRGGSVEKVVLIMPDPETLFFQGNFRACQRFTHALRMASFLSGTQGRKWNLFDQKGAQAMILRAYAAKDTKSLTLNTLDHHIQEWLCRKGFRTAEDVRELQDLSPTKSLIEACFMLMTLIPRIRTGVDYTVVEERRIRAQKKIKQHIPKDIAIAVRELYRKKLKAMLNRGPDTLEVDRAEIRTMLERDSAEAQVEMPSLRPTKPRDKAPNLPVAEAQEQTLALDPTGSEEQVPALDVTEAREQMPELDPAETEEYMSALDESKAQPSRHWTPNPTGVGLTRSGASIAGKTGWDNKREEVIKGLINGKESFGLLVRKGRKYIALSGWSVNIFITCPVTKDDSIYVTADISRKGSQHEHTCFESNIPELRRLAFWVKIVSQSGESTFWAQNVEFRSQELLKILFGRLATHFDSNIEKPQEE